MESCSVYFFASCVLFTWRKVVELCVCCVNNSLFLIIDFPISRVDLKL